MAYKKKSKELATVMARLEYLEQRDAQHDILGRKFKAFAASLHEVEDQLEKQGIKVRRLNQISRNSERLLRQNGLWPKGRTCQRPAPLKWNEKKKGLIAALSLCDPCFML